MRLEGLRNTQRIDTNNFHSQIPPQPKTKLPEKSSGSLIGLQNVIQQVAGNVKAPQAPNNIKPTEGPPQPVSYERFDKTLDYMFSEMKTNAGSDKVKGIKSQLDYADRLMNPKDWKERLLNGFAMAGGADPGTMINSALVTWGLEVRPGGNWDHKPKLDKMLGLKESNDYFFPVRGEGKHELFYDAWSNIHYGYVGTAAGFDAKTLQDGAQAADGVAGRNDKVDEVTVQIGIDLWNKYGANMTKEQFHQELINRLPDIIKAQESQDFKQVIPINPDKPAK